VDALLAALGAPPALREKLAGAAAGNPLFVEELVAMLADQGLLGGDAEMDELELPVGINALLTARLDQLGAGSRDALERGAVEGEVFHQGAVVELSEPTARQDVPERLDELESRDLVRPTAGTVMGEVAFRFKHLLVREAAYRATAKRLRAALHERFADWLERLAGDRVAEYEEIIGYHLEQAYRYRREIGSLDDEVSALGERGAAHVLAAAWRAEALSNFDAAANLFERALAIGLAEPHNRVRIQAELCSALGQTQRPVAESEQVFVEVIETATRLGERGIAAEALIRLGWNRTGDMAVSGKRQMADCYAAIETFTELGNERGLADARRLLGLMLGNAARPDEARQVLELALRNADAAGDAERRRSVINTLVGAYIIGPTPVTEGIGLAEGLLRTAGSDRILEATLRRSLGVLYAMAARREDALESMARGGAVLDEVRIRRLEVWRYTAAYGRRLCGDREGEERDLRMTWDYFRGMRAFDGRAWRGAVKLAALYCDQSRYGEAADFLGYGHARGEEFSNRVSLGVEARLAAAEGRFDRATELAVRSIAEVETGRPVIDDVDLLASAAIVFRAAGLTAETDEALQRAFAICERKGNLGAAAELGAAAAAL
jgi:tetratricopeptide (TPR) repeat protein